MRADACFLAGDFSGSVAVSRKALQLHPACILLYRALGRSLIALGEYDEARRYFRRALALHSGPQVGLLGEIAYLEAVAGNRDSAAGFLERQQQSARGQHVSRVLLAEIHAASGKQAAGFGLCRTRVADRRLGCAGQFTYGVWWI
jgi:Flp pilus assembly protein TadD